MTFVVQSSFPGMDTSVAISSGSETTFTDNMKAPVHRWFRYSAGYSGQWAEDTIRKSPVSMKGSVLDPFVGSGTTLLAAERVGADSIGLEPHPLVVRIARAKLDYRTDADAFYAHAQKVRRVASDLSADELTYPSLIHRVFAPSALAALDSLRRAEDEEHGDDPESRLTWLALVSSLRQASHAGTAPWQYVLPTKTKANVADPLVLFSQRIEMFQQDMRRFNHLETPRAVLRQADARLCDGVDSNTVSLVVTSPPYPNNYDYADATRLEMSFLKEVEGWGDLQNTVRRHLMRSCTQHVPESSLNLDECLARPELSPIRDQLSGVCQELSEVRLTKGGKKTYHLMVASYFLDIAQTWLALRRVCQTPSEVCFVIGDSAPYGVYVPVVEWMGALAKAAGFSAYSFTKTRDRNIKWKNRKHQVPLLEGHFWVEG